MSFFFDVWTSQGFVLASDVRFVVNGKTTHGHKIRLVSPSYPVMCAIVVCGDYPDACLSFFNQATAAGNTLRHIAQRFAEKWTERYSNGIDVSAAHLVGYERIAGTDMLVPQVWYWNNWEEAVGFYPETTLRERLATFNQPIPFNNHLPQKVAELTGKRPAPGLLGELELVSSFLRLSEPMFSWNGDIAFWRSAAAIVGSTINLVGRERPTWSISDTVRLTKKCLNFLVDIGKLVPKASVGIGPDRKFDVAIVTPNQCRFVSQSRLEKKRSEKSK